MIFNSAEFLVFAGLFFGAWYLLRWHAVRLTLLVSASFLFYAWWDWRFLFLLVITGAIDFTAAWLMEVFPKWKTPLLVVSLSSNLGILMTFKYLGFFLRTAGQVSGLGDDWMSFADQIVLPVGISFYTFQSMSYTIDVYRGELRPVKNLLNFYAFLSMFPQLVAGPIERGTHVLSQLSQRRDPTPDQFRDGWTLIVFGFFQKCFLADNLGPVVDQAFRDHAQHESGTYWWMIAAMFSIQILSDFGGYSLIACGLSRLMGVELMRNFRDPYNATSFSDFWSRWHISLSQWFRDYLYIPLGGNRGSAWLTHRNLWITMCLSGLWHGAGLNFIAWGAFHAALLSFERLTSWPRQLKKLGIVGSLLSQGVVVSCILLSWVFFRATSLSQATWILQRMLSPGTWDGVFSLEAGGIAFVVGLAILFAVAAREYLIPRVNLRPIAFLCLPVLVVVTVFGRGSGNAFIYFQF